MSIDIGSDDHFELMVRNAWHLTGGNGHSENTSNKRVCVIWENGDQTVEEIEVRCGHWNSVSSLQHKLLITLSLRSRRTI